MRLCVINAEEMRLIYVPLLGICMENLSGLNQNSKMKKEIGTEIIYVMSVG
jgi:hypothetical protein